MSDENCQEFLFVEACFSIFPIKSERIRLFDMFNFELKKYIPYIVITIILITAMIPIKKFRDFRKIIFKSLILFNMLVFPCMFFYAMEGLSGTTITFIISSCLTTVILVASLIYKKYKGLPINEKTTTFILLLVLVLGILALFIINIVLLYKSEGPSATVFILIASTCIMVVIAMAVLIYNCQFLPNTVRMIVLGVSILILVLSVLGLIGLSIYSIVMVIKSLKFKFKIKLNLNAYLFINYVLGIIILFLHKKIIGPILFYLVSGIDFYIIYYLLTEFANPISLLLFWASLWYIFFGIYTAIESFIAGKKDIIKENSDSNDMLDDMITVSFTED
ncbi:unnamed protein product [Rhizophagus irregularis]|nr:unnamed protein product [Rhizophagus irregularis]